MTNWYVFKDNTSGLILSVASDDSAGFPLAPKGVTVMGPYASQQAAQQANQPIAPTLAQSTITILQTMPSANWTLQNVADWLKSKG